MLAKIYWNVVMVVVVVMVVIYIQTMITVPTCFYKHVILFSFGLK
jgi:hypothetical protein